MEQCVFVIGGAAVNITGRPESVCRMRDSNLGTVRMQPGGVGKNIAAHLTRYGVSVELVTAIGRGFHAKMIRDDCAAYGVQTTYTLVCDEHTGTYLCVLDEEGELLTGINDMSITNHLTPEYLSGILDAVNASAFVALDANLSAEALDYLCRHVTVPVFFDPVSCAKAERIGGNIGRCYAVKPNRFEAAAISGRSCDTIRGVYRAADWFLSQGVKRVFISLGSEGVLWADANGCGVAPAEAKDVVDAAGAGDAMSASIVHGCLTGRTSEECAMDGNVASAAACRMRTV